MPSTDLPSLHAIASRLKFRQLRLLIAVDDLGSLYRAAEHLSMTQPGASKALQELEDVFGTELFERRSNGLVANDLGRCVIRYARLIGTDLDHLRDEMVGILRGQGGRIAVGAIAGALPTLVVGAIRSLKKREPSVSIELVEDTSVGLLQLLAEGRLDLAVCRMPPGTRQEFFEFEWLSDERVAAAVGPLHPLADVQSVDLQKLLVYPWVLFPSQMPLRTLLERELLQVGLPFPAYPIETSSTFASMLLLSDSSDLVAFFSAETADLFARHGFVRRLPLTLVSRVESYGLVQRRGSKLTPSAAILIEEIKLEARRLGANEADSRDGGADPPGLA